MLEYRGDQAYYYRYRKEGGRVRRLYVGSGEQAEQAAAEDAARRAERKARGEAWAAERNRLDTIDAPLKNLVDGTLALARAQLMLAGFFRNDRGAWRKRRG